VIAEIELRDDRERFDRPPWLGVEATGQPQYCNRSLARQCYCPSWFACERWLSTDEGSSSAPQSFPLLKIHPWPGSLRGGAAPQPGTRRPLGLNLGETRSDDGGGIRNQPGPLPDRLALDHCTPPDGVSWQINQPASESVATPATPRRHESEPGLA
jgi:hypothetical protein